MTRTSVTELGSTPEILREAARRLGHASSNAANAAAVNVEALRSRVARGAIGDDDSLKQFAENAAKSMEQVAAGTVAVRALLRAIAASLGVGDRLMAQPASGEDNAVELVAHGSVGLEPSAERFAAAAGVTLRQTETGVILGLLRQANANVENS